MIPDDKSIPAPANTPRRSHFPRLAQTETTDPVSRAMIAMWSKMKLTADILWLYQLDMQLLTCSNAASSQTMSPCVDLG